MNDECVLRCEENYESTKEGDEYVCKAKECDDRTPFLNGSCSVKEDFVETTNPVKCYSYRQMHGGGNTCAGQCSSNFIKVFFFLSFVNYYWLLLLMYFLF
jgi:hypothetical protein